MRIHLFTIFLFILILHSKANIFNLDSQYSHLNTQYSILISQYSHLNTRFTKDSLLPPKHFGKVSHQYKTKGCSTVIIIKRTDGDIILIPKTPLPKALDKNNLEIKFDYRVLRIPNPKGCEKGQPAEITNCSRR